MNQAPAGLSVTNVDVGALTSVGSTISELRLSRDGVRAAMIIDGKVYLAVVVRTASGVYALTSPRAVASGLGSTALSLDWSNSDTIVIARSGADIPVVQVAIDGSRMDALPSGNLTAPVTSVDASPTHRVRRRRACGVPTEQQRPRRGSPLA